MPEKSFDPQQMIGEWQRSITGAEPSTSHMVGQVQQEGHEIYDLVKDMTTEEIDNLPREVRVRLIQETGDIIIAGYGLLEVLGADFENVFWGSFSKMIEKYPPGVIREIMSEENLTRQEAMAKQKVIFNGE